MSWFVYVIRLKRGIDRNKIIKYLNEQGVQCKPYFTPIHLQPFYRKMFGYKEGDFPVTEDVTGRTIALPFFNNLKEEQIDYVVEKLKNSVQRIGAGNNCGKNTRKVASYKVRDIKKVASYKVRVASKEIKYQERYEIQEE